MRLQLPAFFNTILYKFLYALSTVLSTLKRGYLHLDLEGKILLLQRSGATMYIRQISILTSRSCGQTDYALPYEPDVPTSVAADYFNSDMIF